MNCNVHASTVVSLHETERKDGDEEETPVMNMTFLQLPACLVRSACIEKSAGRSVCMPPPWPWSPSAAFHSMLCLLSNCPTNNQWQESRVSQAARINAVETNQGAISTGSQSHHSMLYLSHRKAAKSAKFSTAAKNPPKKIWHLLSLSAAKFCINIVPTFFWLVS